MHDNQIDYIEFPATDIAAIKAFYQTAFGWKFQDYGSTYTAFEDGRLTGGFTMAERGPGRMPLVILYASDLEATEARVKAAGGTVVQEIFKFPGGRRFHFADPSGNHVGVWSDK